MSASDKHFSLFAETPEKIEYKSDSILMEQSQNKTLYNDVYLPGCSDYMTPSIDVNVVEFDSQSNNPDCTSSTTGYSQKSSPVKSFCAIITPSEYSQSESTLPTSCQSSVYSCSSRSQNELLVQWPPAAGKGEERSNQFYVNSVARADEYSNRSGCSTQLASSNRTSSNQISSCRQSKELCRDEMQGKLQKAAEKGKHRLNNFFADNGSVAIQQSNQFVCLTPSTSHRQSSSKPRSRVESLGKWLTVEEKINCSKRISSNNATLADKQLSQVDSSTPRYQSVPLYRQGCPVSNTPGKELCHDELQEKWLEVAEKEKDKIKSIKIEEVVTTSSPLLDNFRRQKREDPGFYQSLCKPSKAIGVFPGDENECKMAPTKKPWDFPFDKAYDDFYRKILPSDSDEEWNKRSDFNESEPSISDKKTKRDGSHIFIPDDRLSSSWDLIYESDSEPLSNTENTKKKSTFKKKIQSERSEYNSPINVDKKQQSVIKRTSEAAASKNTKKNDVENFNKKIISTGKKRIKSFTSDITENNLVTDLDKNKRSSKKIVKVIVSDKTDGYFVTHLDKNNETTAKRKVKTIAFEETEGNSYIEVIKDIDIEMIENQKPPVMKRSKVVASKNTKISSAKKIRKVIAPKESVGNLVTDVDETQKMSAIKRSKRVLSKTTEMTSSIEADEKKKIPVLKRAKVISKHSFTKKGDKETAIKDNVSSIVTEVDKTQKCPAIEKTEMVASETTEINSFAVVAENKNNTLLKRAKAVSSKPTKTSSTKKIDKAISSKDSVSRLVTEVDKTQKAPKIGRAKTVAYRTTEIAELSEIEKSCRLKKSMVTTSKTTEMKPVTEDEKYDKFSVVKNVKTVASKRAVSICVAEGEKRKKLPRKIKRKIHNEDSVQVLEENRSYRNTRSRMAGRKNAPAVTDCAAIKPAEKKSAKSRVRKRDPNDSRKDELSLLNPEIFNKRILRVRLEKLCIY